MKAAKKFLCVLLVLSMLMSSMMYVSAAQEVEEPLQAVEEILQENEQSIQDVTDSLSDLLTDSPSEWAQTSVFMASACYNLGDESTYIHYSEKLTQEDFASVHTSLNSAFSTSDVLETKNGEAVTRGEVINELYDIIAAALELDANASAIDYFVANKLITGRSQGDYQLDSACTKQEMIVFTVGVYEFLCEELGLTSKGLLWKVSDEDNTVYLLGSIHLTDGSVYPFGKNIKNAFKDSQHLVVEANVLNPDMDEITYMSTMGMIQDEGTIKDYISEEIYEIYAQVCQQFGIPAEIYDKLMPWYAAIAIQQLMLMMPQETAEGEIEAAQNSAALGIDMVFLLTAGNKDIIELESIKYQTDMFASFSPELQEAYLLGTIYAPENEDGTVNIDGNIEMQKEMLADMISVWKAGNAEGMMKYVSTETDEPLLQEYYDKLLIIRNKGMAEKIDKFLTDDSETNYFTVVGAAHILGDEGLVKTLEDMGYTVERL